MASRICVDASLVLKLVLREPDSPLAEALWTEWLASGVQICAPTLLEFETTYVQPV
jgi:predicted nucleic acid-binding protein